MSDAIQRRHPQGEYELPPYEIVVEEFLDDEDGQYSAVEKNKNHTRQGSASVGPHSDTRTRSSYTETNTRYTDGRQKYQQDAEYSRPRVYDTRDSYGSYTEAVPQRTWPCPRLHIRHTSNAAYREATPQRASPLLLHLHTLRLQTTRKDRRVTLIITWEKGDIATTSIIMKMKELEPGNLIRLIGLQIQQSRLVPRRLVQKLEIFRIEG